MLFRSEVTNPLITLKDADIEFLKNPESFKFNENNKKSNNNTPIDPWKNNDLTYMTYEPIRLANLPGFNQNPPPVPARPKNLSPITKQSNTNITGTMNPLHTENFNQSA